MARRTTMTNVWFETDEDSILHQEAMDVLPSGRYAALALSPLASGRLNPPDLALLYGTPGQMIILINGLQFSGYRKFEWSVVGGVGLRRFVGPGAAHGGAVALDSLLCGAPLRRGAGRRAADGDSAALPAQAAGGSGGAVAQRAALSDCAAGGFRRTRRSRWRGRTRTASERGVDIWAACGLRFPLARPRRVGHSLLGADGVAVAGDLTRDMSLRSVHKDPARRRGGSRERDAPRRESARRERGLHRVLWRRQGCGARAREQMCGSSTCTDRRAGQATTAHGGCLGTSSRRRTWRDCDKPGGGVKQPDPWISEWGNPAAVMRRHPGPNT